MPAKVCILTTVHQPFDTRIFHKQAKTLVDAGYDVTLIAQHDRDKVVEGVKIVSLPTPRNRFTRIFGLTWRAFRMALQQQADIYHFHDPELLPWGVLLQLCTKAKIIYDVHENVPMQILDKEWVGRPFRVSLSFLYRILERAAIHFIDLLILAEGSYTNTYTEKARICVVRNYPLLSLAEGNMPQPQAVLYRIVYVGGITLLRGAIEMIKSAYILAQRREDIQWVLIGPVSPPELHAKLKAETRQKALTKQLSIRGRVPFKEAQLEVRRSHIGLSLLHPSPNYVRSLPTKLFEYMAAGLPVITSNFPLWKEIVEGNECGLTVDPLDPEGIAEAIDYLLENPEIREKMGENGRRAVLEKYNWDHEMQKLLALYEELLNEAD